MRQVRRSFAVALLMLAAGCGQDASNSSDAEPMATSSPTVASAASVDGLLQCDLDPIGFKTSMASCDAAVEEGLRLAFTLGVINSKDAPGSALGFTTLCMVMQGTRVMTYSIADNFTLAENLNASGVCPGNLSNLQYSP